MSKRPPTVRGDEDRALIGRDRRTPARGIPVEIDPEVTPPPREPQDITAFEDFEKISTAVRQPLLAIHQTQRELDVAIARLWDVRNVGEQVADLKSAIAAIATRFDSFGDVGEVLRAYTARTHALVTWSEEQRRVNAKLETTLDGIDRRMQSVELEHRTITATLGAIVARFDAEARAAKELEAEIKAALDEQSKRLRMVEDEQLAAKTTVKTAGWFGKGIYVVLAGAIAAAISWFMSSSRK